MIPSLSRVFYQRQWQTLNENNEPSGARQNMLEFAARLSVSWTRGPRRVRPGRRPREAPLMHVAKEDLRAPPVYSPSALGKRAHGGLARRRLATAKVSVDIDGVPKGAAFQRTACHSPNENPAQEREGRGLVGLREIQLSLARCHHLFFEETVPLLFRTLWRRARLVVAVTAKCIGVFDAHIAAFTRAGSRVPFPRALAWTGIRLARNIIGRRTRARGVDESTAGGLTGRSTVGSAGVPLGRVIRLRRVIRWRRTIAWRRRAILCICPHHPGGRSQNAHACDSDQSAFHRLPPFGQNKWGESNVRIRRMFRTMPGKLSL
jgi:hypothetical protein